MARPELHDFERLAKNKPAKGSNDYPVAIKAKHLDENWKRTTLLEGSGEPKLYEVEYTKDGTRITKIFKDGTNVGDLLFWNGARWAVFSAPEGDDLKVLTIQGGTLAWLNTEDCGAEE
jgi:hypothetical protein